MLLPAIGIIGGVGPWVDPLLLEKILLYEGSLGMRHDQDGIPLLLAQYPSLIPDRTEYLLSAEAQRAGENPALGAARVARTLAAAGARIIGIPCNTFHARPIYESFQQQIAPLLESEDPLELVHMVRATVQHIRQNYPSVRRVGVLSTSGTYVAGVYSHVLKQEGLAPVELPYEPRCYSLQDQAARKQAILSGHLEPTQNDVHHAITNPEWGVKSGRQASEGFPDARGVLKAAARQLIQAGADLVVFGCTEVPLALPANEIREVPVVDPLDVLARALVDAWRARFNPAWPAARELPSLPGSPG